MFPISLSTPIADLDIPYWDMVLEEKFLIHPSFVLKKDLKTVDDLVYLSRWDPLELIKHLKWLHFVLPTLPLLDQDIFDFNQNHPSAVLLNICLSKPHRSDIGSISLNLREIDFEKFLASQKHIPVVIQAETPEKGASACLYLMEEGLEQVKFVTNNYHTPSAG